MGKKIKRFLLCLLADRVAALAKPYGEVNPQTTSPEPAQPGDATRRERRVME